MLSRLLLVSIAVFSCGTCIAQSLPECGQAEVEYRAPLAELSNKIRVKRPERAENAIATAEKTRSPQGTRWFVRIDPNYFSTEKPWNTTLQIGSGTSNRMQLRADFLDHGNTFDAHWINEELLFIQVWWGRFASSDLILNVNTGTFIYNRFALYEALGEPCRNPSTADQ